MMYKRWPRTSTLLRRILSGWSMLLRETLCERSFMTTTAFSVPVYDLNHRLLFAAEFSFPFLCSKVQVMAVLAVCSKQGDPWR